MLKKVQSTTILLSVVVKLFLSSALSQSLKQPTCCDTTTGFSAKCRLRNERRNSILMRCHYSDQSSASDWSCREGNLLQPIRSTTQIQVVTRLQYARSWAHFFWNLVAALRNVGCFLRLHFPSSYYFHHVLKVIGLRWQD